MSDKSAFFEPPAGEEWALDEVTGAIIDAAMRIHIALGPGLLESVYESVHAKSLSRRFVVQRQQVVRFEYDGMSLEEGLRLDLLVDNRVVVEVKSVEKLAPVTASRF